MIQRYLQNPRQNRRFLSPLPVHISCLNRYQQRIADDKRMKKDIFISKVLSSPAHRLSYLRGFSQSQRVYLLCRGPEESRFCRMTRCQEIHSRTSRQVFFKSKKDRPVSSWHNANNNSSVKRPSLCGSLAHKPDARKQVYLSCRPRTTFVRSQPAPQAEVAAMRHGERSHDD